MSMPSISHERPGLWLPSHVFSQANTYVTTRGQRVCRTCEAERERKRYWANKRLIGGDE